MTMKRRAFASALGAAAAVAPRSARAQLTNGIVAVSTIGVAAPVSGDNRRAGEQLGDGVRQAINDYNYAKASFDRGYTMRALDDQNSLAGAMVASDFANNDPTIVAVIGHLSASATIGAERQYAENSMPLIVPTASADAITQQPTTKLVRLATRDTDEGRLHATTSFKDAKAATVITLTQDGDYGSDVARAFAGYYDEKKVTSKIVVFGIEKPNYKGAAAAAFAEKPDLIFLAGNARDMGPVVPQLRALGYTGPFRGSSGFFDPLTPTFDLDGIVVSSSMPPLALAPAAFQIRQDFEARYGPMSPLAAFGYASTQIAIAAVKRAASVQRASVLRALQQPTQYDTVVGSFTFNGRGDSFDPNLYFYELDAGKWVYQHAAHPSTFLIR
jgi:branched-chain amino acid transport system substrate-binding protein